MRKIQNWILEKLQRGCPHLPDWVSVDILEGDYPGLEIKCCNRRGAVMIMRNERSLLFNDEPPAWREPRATWTERVVF
jgi:hypothetical protein